MSDNEHEGDRGSKKSKTTKDVPPNLPETNLRTPQQVVIPSENNRIRKGQVDWIEGLETSSDDIVRLWIFTFQAGADIYLSREVYPNPVERRKAWLYALVRAAVLGKNQLMKKYLQVLDHKNVSCETFLKQLEKRYLPTVQFEKNRIIKKYRGCNRENRSLWDTYKAFQQLEARAGV